MKVNHSVTCPECGEVFDTEMDPDDPKDCKLVTCPECGEESGWEYSAESGMVLLASEDEDEDFEDDEDDEFDVDEDDEFDVDEDDDL